MCGDSGVQCADIVCVSLCVCMCVECVTVRRERWPAGLIARIHSLTPTHSHCHYLTLAVLRLFALFQLLHLHPAHLFTNYLSTTFVAADACCCRQCFTTSGTYDVLH